jgi:hypothetical protein
MQRTDRKPKPHVEPLPEPIVEPAPPGFDPKDPLPPQPPEPPVE